MRFYKSKFQNNYIVLNFFLFFFYVTLMTNFYLIFFRIQERGLTEALAMINAIQLMNKSPLLAEVNVSLGYCIVDSCSDVSAALRATQDWSRQENQCSGSSPSVCSQPVMAVVGPYYSEISIALAQHLTLQMIPMVRT